MVKTENSLYVLIREETKIGCLNNSFLYYLLFLISVSSDELVPFSVSQCLSHETSIQILRHINSQNIKCWFFYQSILFFIYLCQLDFTIFQMSGTAWFALGPQIHGTSKEWLWTFCWLMIELHGFRHDAAMVFYQVIADCRNDPSSTELPIVKHSLCVRCATIFKKN